jgi:predicted nuclease of restriction endonuclease-like RecB superfamily
MLTSDLVLSRREGDRVVPFRLDPEEPAHLRLAEALIELFSRHVGQPREVLNAALADFVGASPAFRIPRCRHLNCGGGSFWRPLSSIRSVWCPACSRQ